MCWEYRSLESQTQSWSGASVTPAPATEMRSRPHEALNQYWLHPSNALSIESNCSLFPMPNTVPDTEQVLNAHSWMNERMNRQMNQQRAGAGLPRTWPSMCDWISPFCQVGFHIACNISLTVRLAAFISIGKEKFRMLLCNIKDWEYAETATKKEIRSQTQH